MRLIDFNANDYVRVKLRPEGEAAMRNRHEGLRAYSPAFGPWEPRLDAEGFMRMQLWEVMQVFGPLIQLGRESPFETSIKIEVAE